MRSWDSYLMAGMAEVARRAVETGEARSVRLSTATEGTSLREVDRKRRRLCLLVKAEMMSDSDVFQLMMLRSSRSACFVLECIECERMLSRYEFV